MFNYLLKIEYEGTNFVGWQSQKNGQSIQDSIETVLKKILKKNIRTQMILQCYRSPLRHGLILFKN